MDIESIKELNEACKLADNVESYGEAEAIFEKYFNESPQDFRLKYRSKYAWLLYRRYIKDSRNPQKMEATGELISKLVKQSNRAVDSRYPCVYTLTMFALAKYFKDINYRKSQNWILKLKPSLLCREYNIIWGEKSISDLEKFYSSISYSFLKLENYDLTIKSSREALEKIENFHNHSEVWFYRRIALSQTALGQYEDSIKNYEYVIKYKKEGYIYRELAENYYALRDYDTALKYLIEAVLIKEPINRYVKYDMLVQVLEKLDLNDKLDLHKELYETARNGDYTKAKSLISELMPYWESLKFKDKLQLTGYVSVVFGNGHSGKISLFDDCDVDVNEIVESLGIKAQGLDLDKFYYSSYDVKGGIKLKKYDSVSFYIKKGFNRKYKRYEANATNIELIEL